MSNTEKKKNYQSLGNWVNQNGERIWGQDLGLVLDKTNSGEGGTSDVPGMRGGGRSSSGLGQGQEDCLNPQGWMEFPREEM